MMVSANLDGPVDIRLTVDENDALDVVETEMALVQRALERLARRSAIHRDLDRASYLAARTLEATGPISLKDLAARLGVDASTMTRQIATMEGDGLLHRYTDPADGRVSLVDLSSAGRRKMRTVQRARRDRIHDLFAGWSKREQLEFGRLLGRFNDAVSHSEHHNSQPNRRGRDVPVGRRGT
jgi:DNA-binding MarR family transcriptional regulator